MGGTGLPDVARHAHLLAGQLAGPHTCWYAQSRYSRRQMFLASPGRS